MPKEESENDSPQQLCDSELDKTSGTWDKQGATSMTSHHKNVALVIILSSSEFVKLVQFYAYKVYI